jgi:hypothetical protein
MAKNKQDKKTNKFLLNTTKNTKDCAHVKISYISCHLIQNLANNGLGPTAAKYLSIAITHTRFLQQLNLSGKSLNGSVYTCTFITI